MLRTLLDLRHLDVFGSISFAIFLFFLISVWVLRKYTEKEKHLFLVVFLSTSSTYAV